MPVVAGTSNHVWSRHSKIVGKIGVVSHRPSDSMTQISEHRIVSTVVLCFWNGSTIECAVGHPRNDSKMPKCEPPTAGPVVLHHHWNGLMTPSLEHPTAWNVSHCPPNGSKMPPSHDSIAETPVDLLPVWLWWRAIPLRPPPWNVFFLQPTWHPVHLIWSNDSLVRFLPFLRPTRNWNNCLRVPRTWNRRCEPRTAPLSNGRT